MLEELKKQVYDACMELYHRNLAIFTWGQCLRNRPRKEPCGDKAVGCGIRKALARMLPVVDLYSGKVVEGELNPSSDTPTHLELYRRFASVGGITHTHSKWATVFSQCGRDIACYGTTHADYFDGNVPCTRKMTPEEIAGEYELETGKVIAETFEENHIDPMRVPAVLVHSHAPFTWGKTPMASVNCAVTLEYVAEMAYNTEMMQNALYGNIEKIQEELLRKHFDRKHGPGAYYGQKKK